MSDESKRLRLRDATRRYRERQRLLGIKALPRTEAQKEQQRVAIRGKRESARTRGIRLPGDNWAQQNPERHRENGARWRAQNPERASELMRRNQEARRSTPWGRINNCMWPIIHNSMFVVRQIGGKYRRALGYSWSELRSHLESQFLPGMSWDNWGDVWELDHITPLSTFHYVSLEDPLFRQAWALTNLRPLWTEANQAKGCKLPQLPRDWPKRLV